MKINKNLIGWVVAAAFAAGFAGVLIYNATTGDGGTSASSQAHAKPLSASAAAAAPQFANWTSSRGNVAKGTLLGKWIQLSGSHVSEDPYSTVDGSHTYFAQSYFTPSLELSDAIEFRGHPNTYSYTLSFEAAIQNPVIHFGSLASTLTFTTLPAGTSISRLSGENASFSVSGNTVSGGLDGPNDSNGTVQLNGTFPSPVSFTARVLPTDGSYLDGIYIQVGAEAGGPPPPPPPPPGCNSADYDMLPTRSTQQDENTRLRAENAIICLTNEERQKKSAVDGKYRPVLGFDAALQKAARYHSEDMAARDYFAHCHPSVQIDGKCPPDKAEKLRMQQFGYCSTTCYTDWSAENISWGTGSYSTPRNVVKRWMESCSKWDAQGECIEGHRANILNPKGNEIGVGVSLDAPTSYTGQAATYTQVFGSRG